VRIPLLAVVFAIGLAMFISIDPVRPWILLALTAIMGLGADGIIRSHPRGEFHTIADTAPYLFVPVLFTLSAGLFLEDVVLSYWAAPAVVGAGVLMGAPVDLAEHRLLGTPVQLVDNVGVNASTGLAIAAASRSTLFYQSGSQLSRLVVVGANGPTRTILGDRREYAFPRLSPDGRRIRPVPGLRRDPSLPDEGQPGAEQEEAAGDGGDDDEDEVSGHGWSGNLFGTGPEPVGPASPASLGSHCGMVQRY